MTKVLVFGAGGVGCIYAWILEKAGAHVTAVCRSNYSVVKERGISISSKIWSDVHANPTAVRTVAEAVERGLGPFDYILVTSKAFPGTCELIKDAVTEETAIVLAQNGIGIEEEYKELFPNNTIISGVVYLPTTQVKPGYIEMAPLELLELGLYPSPSKTSTTGAGSSIPNGDSGYHSPSSEAAQSQLQAFADLFTKAGATTKIFEDIQAPRWIKLSVNAAWNPVCALTRCDDANYLRSSGSPALPLTWPPQASGPRAFNSMAEVYAVMQEVADLAAAAGYPGVVTEATIRKQLERPERRLTEGGKEPSMLTDVRFNRAMEVDAILGNAVKIAERVGWGDRVPRLRLLCALARGLNYSMVPDERWRPIG